MYHINHPRSTSAVSHHLNTCLNPIRFSFQNVHQFVPSFFIMQCCLLILVSFFVWMSISYLLTESSCWCRSKTQFGPKRKLISSFQLSEPAHQNLLRQDSISSLRNPFLMTQLMLKIKFKSPRSRSNHPSYMHFYNLPSQGKLQSNV